MGIKKGQGVEGVVKYVVERAGSNLIGERKSAVRRPGVDEIQDMSGSGIRIK